MCGECFVSCSCEMENFGRPQISRASLDVLDNKNSFEEPLLSKYHNCLWAGVIGFFSVTVANIFVKKPAFSGIHRHAIATAGFAAVAKYVDDYRIRYYADREAMFRHYIELHPEDFPPFEKKKYKDVFEEWVPVR